MQYCFQGSYHLSDTAVVKLYQLSNDLVAVQHVCLLANNISSAENVMQQNGDPD